jgi:hypothetical protein
MPNCLDSAHKVLCNWNLPMTLCWPRGRDLLMNSQTWSDKWIEALEPIKALSLERDTCRHRSTNKQL